MWTLWTGVTAVLAKHRQTRTLTDFHGLAAFGDEVDRGERLERGG